MNKFNDEIDEIIEKKANEINENYDNHYKKIVDYYPLFKDILDVRLPEILYLFPIGNNGYFDYEKKKYVVEIPYNLFKFKLYQTDRNMYQYLYNYNLSREINDFYAHIMGNVVASQKALDEYLKENIGKEYSIIIRNDNKYLYIDIKISKTQYIIEHK